MDIDNFRIWWNSHREAFPSLDEWLSKTPDPQATLRAWQEVFTAKQVQLADALAVTKSMLAGDIEPPEAFDRDKTPAIVAKHARELAYRRRHGGVGAPSESERAGRCENLTQAYREARECHKAGGDVSTVMRRYFGGDDLNDRRVRYSCVTCRDSGLVECVGAHSLEEMERIIAGAPMRQMVARCICKRGDTINGVIGSFDSARMCRMRSSRSETRAALAELVHEIKTRPDPRRVTAFDAWNEGA